MTKRRARLLGIALVAIGAGAPARSAEAQPPKGAAPDPAAEARQRFNEGVELADAGNHEAARLKFEQAWSVLKSPAILFNLARAEQLSGHLVEALGHYRQFSKLASDPKITDAQRQRATENAAELSKKVGQIELDAPTAARVTIDGAAVTTGGGDPVVVSAGSHVVEGALGSDVRRITVDAPPGTVTRAKLTFDAAPPASESSPPPSSSPPPPSPSPHADATQTRTIVAGSLAAVSVIAGGIALGFLVDSNGKASGAKDYDREIPGGACAQRALPSCGTYSSKLDDASSSRTISYVGLGAFLVFAAGAAVTWALWPTAPAKIGRNSLGLSADF